MRMTFELFRKLSWIGILGNIIIVFGLIGLTLDFVQRGQLLAPFDLGVTLGNCAITLVGLVAAMVGDRLKKFRERLDKLEGCQNGN